LLKASNSKLLLRVANNTGLVLVKGYLIVKTPRKQILKEAREPICIFDITYCIINYLVVGGF